MKQPADSGENSTSAAFPTLPRVPCLPQVLLAAWRAGYLALFSARRPQPANCATCL